MSKSKKKKQVYKQKKFKQPQFKVSTTATPTGTINTTTNSFNLPSSVGTPRATNQEKTFDARNRRRSDKIYESSKKHERAEYKQTKEFTQRKYDREIKKNPQPPKKSYYDTRDIFGIPGTPEYNRNVKQHFGIAGVDLKELANVKDEKRRFEILAKQNMLEERINSGEFLETKINTAMENVRSVLETYSSDTIEIEDIMYRIENSGDKMFNIVSEIWEKLKQYYRSAKENVAGGNPDRASTDMDDAIDSIENILSNFNI